MRDTLRATSGLLPFHGDMLRQDFLTQLPDHCRFPFLLVDRVVELEV